MEQKPLIAHIAHHQQVGEEDMATKLSLWSLKLIRNP